MVQRKWKSAKATVQLAIKRRKLLMTWSAPTSDATMDSHEAVAELIAWPHVRHIVEAPNLVGCEAKLNERCRTSQLGCSGSPLKCSPRAPTRKNRTG